jgi:hypothetical protein
MLPLYERLSTDKRVLACAAAMAAGLGRREAKQLGIEDAAGGGYVSQREMSEAQRALRHPTRIWINLGATLTLDHWRDCG